MDIFRQNKLLIRSIFLLALLNVASIGVFVWKDFIHLPPRDNQRDERKQPHRFEENQDISQVLEKDLHLTKTQVEKIQALRTDFFKQERLLSETIRAKKDSMNEIMFNKMTDENIIKSLARGIAENEYQMELLRFEQAKNLKTICTPEQLEKFEKLVIEIRDYFRPVQN